MQETPMAALKVAHDRPERLRRCCIFPSIGNELVDFSWRGARREKKPDAGGRA
jgi:hypothetical protein